SATTGPNSSCGPRSTRRWSRRSRRAISCATSTSNARRTNTSTTTGRWVTDRAADSSERAAADRDLHLHRGIRLVVGAALHAGDLADHGERLARPEDRVLAVEVRRRALGDEELAAVGGWARVGHRE